MPARSVPEVPAPRMIHGSRNFGEVLGLRKTGAAIDEASFEITLSPEHLNRHGTVHGGVLMAMMDAAGLWAICDPKDDVAPVAITVSLNCSFVGRSKVEDTIIRATGKISKKGRRLYFSSVVAEGYPSGQIIAIGQGVYSKSH